MKRVMSALGALLLAAGLTLAIASPAQAEWQDCPTVYNGQSLAGCMWEHTGATGARFHVYEVEGCRNMPYGWGNVVSSLKDFNYNTAGNGYYRVWMNTNCSGANWSISGGWTGSLCQFWCPGPYPDDIESYAWYPQGS